MDNKKELADRLIAEAGELQRKLSKIGGFMYAEEFNKLDATDRRLLREQKDIMEDYIDIIIARIDHLQLVRIAEQFEKENNQ